jgi:hypothetical protein
MKLLDQLAAHDIKYNKGDGKNTGSGKQKLLDIIKSSLKEHPSYKKKKK